MPLPLPELIPATLIALLGAFLIARAQPRRRAVQPQPPAGGAAVLLFDGESLVDATGEAGVPGTTGAGEGNARAAALRGLAQHFPGIETVAPQALDGTFTLSGPVGGLRAGNLGSQLRLTLPDEDFEAVADLQEAERLREIVDDFTIIAWKEDAEGEVIWANRQFLSLCDRLAARSEDGIGDWPRRAPFSVPRPAGEGPATNRLRLGGQAGAEEIWLEVTSLRKASHMLHVAVPIDATVRAERDRQSLKQLFSDTFSLLEIGLGVFDETRVLRSFNPAMTDMLGLPAEFLARWPTLEDMLDHLRHRGLLEEPKDYLAWRREVGTRITGGQRAYRETWRLQNDRRLRITGQPHPQGGFMLMLEDISMQAAERRAHAIDRRIWQASLDGIEAPLAVFTAEGDLRSCNASYAREWADEGDAVPPAVTLERWRTGLRRVEDWQALSEILHGRDPGPGWSTQAVRRDGTALTLHATRLPESALLLRFEARGTGPPFPATRPGLRREDAPILVQELR